MATTLSCTCCKCQAADQKLANELKIPTLYQYCGNRLSTPTISPKFCAFRIFAAAYSLFAVIWNLARFIEFDLGQYWLIFLTQWIAVLTTTYFICISILNTKIYLHLRSSLNLSQSTAASNSTINNGQSPTNSSPTCMQHNDIMQSYRRLGRACDILSSTIVAPSILITLANWTVITNYSTYIEGNDDDAAKVTNDIHMHGILTIFVVIDYALSLSYLPYGGIMYSTALGLLFIIWSLIHYAADFSSPWHKRYIYPMLNWKYPSSAITISFGLLIGDVVFHYLLSYIKYKCLLAKWVNSSRNTAEQDMAYGVALGSPTSPDGNKSDDGQPVEMQDTNVNGVASTKVSSQKSVTLSFEQVQDDEVETSAEPNEAMHEAVAAEEVNVRNATEEHEWEVDEEP